MLKARMSKPAHHAMARLRPFPVCHSLDIRNWELVIPMLSFSLTFPRPALPFSLMLAARAPKTPEHNRICRLLPSSASGRISLKEILNEI